MEQDRNAKSKLESEIRGGVNRGEFVPQFQPLLDMTQFKIRGFEALARLQYPSRGVLEPDDFIEVATRSGLIADLSNAVMAAAIDEATRWLDDLVLSINLPRTELRDPGLAGRTIALIEDAGLPAERREVEVCESSLLLESDVPLATISRLRSLGIGVSLEDFGTGYAALARLRELPFDRIRLTALPSSRSTATVIAARSSRRSRRWENRFPFRLPAKGSKRWERRNSFWTLAPPRGRVGFTATRYLARKPPSFLLP